MEPLQVDESPLKNKSWGRSGNVMDQLVPRARMFARSQTWLALLLPVEEMAWGAEGVCFL